jgi:hypothetical protein
MSLKVKLKNKFEEDRGYAKELAVKIGLSNATPLYKFVNEPDRELDSFDILIKLVREAFDNEFQTMAEYIMTLDPCKKTARYSLEYATINKMNDIRKQLIEKMINCKNAESREWAKIYQISMWGYEGNHTAFELLSMLNDFQPKSIEMIAFKDIEKFYCFYDLRIVDNMITLEKFVRSNLMQIKEPFVRNAFKSRLTIICIDGALHINNSEKVREYESNASIEYEYNVTKFCLQLGNSYMFENFEKANHFLMKSLDAAKRINDPNRISEAERSLNFLYSYHDKEAQYLNFESNEISDVHEVAFYCIKKGDEKGLQILESMDLNKLTDHQKGFHFFYRGLATNNEDFYYDSISHFNKSGEKFYKYVSLNELRKLGATERMLLALAS